jgi:hypothetical protein
MKMTETTIRKIVAPEIHARTAGLSAPARGRERLELEHAVFVGTRMSTCGPGQVESYQTSRPISVCSARS